MSRALRTYFALGALVLGLGALHFSQKHAQDQVEAHSLRAEALAVPSLGLVPADAQRITKLELTVPDRDDSPGQRVTLERRDAGWRITFPIDTAASPSKVDALLDNLVNLKLSERIDSSSVYYERYNLTEAKAFHVLAWRGPDKATELFFGKSSARGELLRVGGVAGAFAIGSTGPGSYSGFLYTRPLRTWRDDSILKFDPASATAIQVDNRYGRFSFTRLGSAWQGSRTARRADGALGAPEKSWPGYNPARVGALLDAFKLLSADEFGREEDRASSGLDQAEHTGGVIQLTLENPARELVIRVGSPAHGPSDWAIKDSRWALNANGDGTLYALALWTTDWVTSDANQFETQHTPSAVTTTNKH